MDILVTNNGVCVLQRNDIVLAFTESYDEALEAQKEFVNDGPDPYNIQYEIWFNTKDERIEFDQQLDMFLGEYKSSFILKESDESIILFGFCIL